jgi:eukaryotic-like serine/threonine-protein kinase
MVAMVGGSEGEAQSVATAYVLLGRYQMLERIGEGGMGVVWRCFDLDLEEPVAIKFLREDYSADDRLRACFRREVKLARRVTHPNVARVFEFGRDGDLHFLTMEYVPGESLLATLQREGRLTPTRVGALAFSLCRGLAAAHAAGVVHGDIKPGNVLVAPGRGAVLTDFGIARARSEALNRDESIGGTPLYMPPEQLLNEAMAPQNDVYAVGVLMFEALTGQVPWPADNEAILIGRKLSEEPNVRALAPGMPPAWADLISDCLRTDPARRPADGRALLTRLAALRGAAAVISGGAGYPAPPPLASSDGPQWIEVVPFGIKEEKDGLGGAWVTSDLISALTRVRGLRVITGAGSGEPRSPVTQVRGELRAVRDGVVVRAEVVPGSGAPSSTVELHQRRTGLHNLGADLAARIVAALPGPRTAMEIPRYDDLHPEAAELYIKARAAFLAMRPDTAVKLYEAALTRAPGHRLLRLGHTLARVESAFFTFRAASEAEVEELRRAVAEVVRDQGELGEAHLAQAAIALALGEPVHAAAAARAALARSPSLVGGHIIVADLLLDIGRLPDADRHLDVALALDGANALGWTSRARLRAYEGRWDEFYALVAGKLAALRYRSVHLARLMLWHPDAAALAQLAEVYAANVDGLPPLLAEAGRALVAFGCGKEDRRGVFDRLMAHPGFAHPRHNRFLAQFQCELACMVGALDPARQLLATAARGEFADWSWIERCPVIEPLRAEPMFAEIRARVRAHADAVAEAIWG